MMPPTTPCVHERRKPEILTDDSVVYDCKDCGEPLVEVNGQWMTVAESGADFKPTPDGQPSS